jgi:hypothetical protein
MLTVASDNFTINVIFKHIPCTALHEFTFIRYVSVRFLHVVYYSVHIYYYILLAHTSVDICTYIYFLRKIVVLPK